MIAFNSSIAPILNDFSTVTTPLIFIDSLGCVGMVFEDVGKATGLAMEAFNLNSNEEV